MANTDDKKPYWHDAMTTFSRMSTWILGPILVALLAGRWLDARYHTAPIMFLSLTGVAFVLSFVGLIREGKRYMQKVSDETERKKEKQNTNERHDPDNSSGN